MPFIRTEVKRAPLNHLLSTTAAIALVALGAPRAVAGDLTVDSNQTTPVSTATGDGSGPGNIMITENGEIVVVGGVAVTVNTSHNLDNQGLIENNGLSDAVGVLVDTGAGITSDILNAGTIRILPANTDTESIGPNFGILVSGAGSLTGDITVESSSVISIDGTGSSVIRIDAPMFGNVQLDGTVNLFGVENTGILVRGPISGTVLHSGSMLGGNQNVVGIAIYGNVGDGVVNQGTIGIGGEATRDNNGDPVAPLIGKAGILVASDVTGGVLNDRLIVEDDPDTPDVDESTQSFNGSITAKGGGNAILITAVQEDGSGADVAIGAVSGSNNFGVVNRGFLQASTDFIDVDAVAVRIEGAEIDSTTYTTTLENGFFNSGEMSALSFDAEATGLVIGDHAIVPKIVNSGTISAQSDRSLSDEDGDGVFEATGQGGDAIGILIEESGSVDRIENSGLIRAIAVGGDVDAIGVLDLSGEVTEFINSGEISVQIPDNTLGQEIAVDLSRAAAGVTFLNSGDITGKVLLGSGADNVTFTGGTMAGDLDFNGGGGALLLQGGSVFSGQLLNASGVGVALTGSTLDITLGEPTINLSSLTADNGSTLKWRISGSDGRVTTVDVAGPVTIASGAKIETRFDSFAFDDQNFEIIVADDLTLEGGLDGIELIGGSILFRSVFAEVQGVRDRLELQLVRRSAEEIGLNANQSSLYEASLGALRSDLEFGAAVANVETLDELQGVFNQMLPDNVSGATREAAIISQNLGLGAIDRRLQSLRALRAANRKILDTEDPQRRSNQNLDLDFTRPAWSIWGQEFVHLHDRKGSVEHGGYDGFTVGFGMGADRPMLGLDAVGISFVQLFSEFKDDLRTSGERIFLSSSQVAGYLSLNAGGFFIDAVGGAAYNNYDDKRRVQIGELLRGINGSWTGYQINGSASTGYRMNLGPFGLTASTNIAYVDLHENGYTETGGGSGVDLVVEDRDTTSLRWNAGIAVDGIIVGDPITFIPRLKAGVTREFETDPTQMDVSFLSTGDAFTLFTPMLDKNHYNAGFGLGFSFGAALVSIDYDADWSTKTFSHIGAVNFRIRF